MTTATASWRRALSYVGVTAVFLGPAVLLVLTSLGPTGGSSGVAPPGAWSSSAYTEVLAAVPVMRWIGRTTVLVVVAVPASVMVAAAAAWAIRIAPTGVRRVLLGLVLILVVVPPSAVWTTRFAILETIGIAGTPAALVVQAAYGTSPLYVVVYLWVFSQIPDVVLDAARLDGAGPVASWWHIGMPQAGAASVAVTTLSLAWHWGNLMEAVLHLRDPASFTIAPGLRLLQQLAPTQWSLLAAAAVIAAFVPVVVFVVGQRRFLGDVHLGGDA